MHRRFRVALASAAVTALTGGLLTVTLNTATAIGARPQADFNGDGYRDLAVSAPLAYVNGRGRAGQVVILYGSATGLNGSQRTVLSQDSPGVPGTAETGDIWGGDTAAADYNNDGFTDLAVGAPGEDISGDVDGGTVQIIWGSSAGLSGGTTVPDPTPTSHDRFGGALEAADFNGDDKADLAIGSSSATIQVYRGGFGTTQGATGGRYTVRPDIQSGGDAGPINLHAGDVNGDDIADLVVDGFETTSDEGWNTNYYLPGSASGLTTSGAKKLPAGIITDIGDTNSDGYGDIVIGMDWDSDTGVPAAHDGGKVSFVFGSAAGPNNDDTSITVIHQNSPAVPGDSEKGDAFGSELHLGDVNGDGHLDLAVGAPGEDLAGVQNSGSVTVLYGAADGSGISGTGAQFFSQDSPGVPNSNETNDGLGSDVHLADLTGDGKADLTIGAAGENGSNGAVYALRSDGSQIASSGGSSIYTSTVGVSPSGTPLFGANFAG